MFTPYTVRGVTLKNRIVVSPMAQYSATDGVVGDYHLVHLGARAMGGAALVFAEMTCVSAEGRITPGCPGMYSADQAQAWQRIVHWVHTQTDAKFGMQIGHAGPKGATRVAWEGIDQPLADGGWPLMAASPQQYLTGISQTAREMTRDDMDAVKAQFVQPPWRQPTSVWTGWSCTAPTATCCPPSFPHSPTSADEYGGSLANRLRYPLEVFAAVRAVWPADRPMSVRISAHDWVEGGITPADAVEVARAFKAAGADMIDCSSGQVSKAKNRCTAACSRPRLPTASARRRALPPLRWGPSARPTMPTASWPLGVPTCAQWPARIWPTRPGR
jgi:anthraniloyl-CoA monooxygenase